MAGNYIFKKNGDLLDFSGSLIHKLINYIYKNRNEFKNTIKKKSGTITLSKDIWNTEALTYDYNGFSTGNLDIGNTDIIITPHPEDFESFTGAGIVCTNMYLQGNETGTNLTFKCSSLPDKDIRCNYLILESSGIFEWSD